MTDAKTDTAAKTISEDESARAAAYSILAALLSHTPSADVIDYLCHIPDSDDATDGIMAEAWQTLRQAATEVDMSTLDDEYHALFIGLGRGEIVPYGSWHITGFLMDQPLSDLRDDLKSLGIESDPKQKEPEDHIAALCETMALLIESPDVDESMQRRFFIRHIQPWAKRFFSQLRYAKTASFYKSVGFLGEHYIDLEGHYLNIQEH